MAKRKVDNPLAAFAADNTPHGGKECALCALPERDVIDEARRGSPGYGAGRKLIGGSMVRRWLIEERGYDPEDAPSGAAIQAHFNNGHHRGAS